MPTINKRFLLKLVLVVFALTGILFAAHAVQAKRIPAALRAQSERAAEAGKTDMAIHYLRQYLEFHPTDVEALVRLAELSEKRAPTQRGRPSRGRTVRGWPTSRNGAGGVVRGTRRVAMGGG